MRRKRGAGHGAQPTLGLAMFATYILSRFRAFLRYRETVHELSRLSDRELADLGLFRVQIASLARQTASA
jgi:uncharacterized protein YjiS (DUF1127 family)